MALAKVGITAIVVLILGLFVLRPILRGVPAQRTDAPLLDDSAGVPTTPGVSGEIVSDIPGERALPGGVAFDEAALGHQPADDAPLDPVERLKTLIEERQDETIAVLKNWIEGADEVAK